MKKTCHIGVCVTKRWRYYIDGCRLRHIRTLKHLRSTSENKESSFCVFYLQQLFGKDCLCNFLVKKIFFEAMSKSYKFKFVISQNEHKYNKVTTIYIKIHKIEKYMGWKALEKMFEIFSSKWFEMFWAMVGFEKFDERLLSLCSALLFAPDHQYTHKLSWKQSHHFQNV